MNRRTKQMGAALVAGAAAVSLVPLQAAIADSSPASEHISFSIQEGGHLIARGVSVTVAIDYTCAPGSTHELSLNARQRVKDGRIANADGEVGQLLTCNGEPQRAEITLDSYEFAFNGGEALVTASAYGCAPDHCGLFEDRLVTRFTKRRPANWDSGDGSTVG